MESVAFLSVIQRQFELLAHGIEVLILMFQIGLCLPLLFSLAVEVQMYQLEEANAALQDLRKGHVRGAKVLQVSS